MTIEVQIVFENPICVSGCIHDGKSLYELINFDDENWFNVDAVPRIGEIVELDQHNLFYFQVLDVYYNYMADCGTIVKILLRQIHQTVVNDSWYRNQSPNIYYSIAKK
jgi:hypothetical protein